MLTLDCPAPSAFFETITFSWLPLLDVHPESVIMRCSKLLNDVSHKNRKKRPYENGVFVVADGAISERLVTNQFPTKIG
jgi:hypothetical protein